MKESQTTSDQLLAAVNKRGASFWTGKEVTIVFNTREDADEFSHILAFGLVQHKKEIANAS